MAGCTVPIMLSSVPTDLNVANPSAGTEAEDVGSMQVWRAGIDGDDENET